MTTFPAPDLLLNPFQELPTPGTPLTEADTLILVQNLLQPLVALAVTMEVALEHEPLTQQVTVPLLTLLWQGLDQAVSLLNAWQAAPKGVSL